MDYINSGLIYNESFDGLCSLINSSIKSRLLLCLFTGEKTLKQLSESLETYESSVISSMKYFEINDQVIKKGKYYYLSSEGKILALNFIKFFEGLSVQSKNRDFWNNHDIESIPEYFLNNMFVFKKGEYIISTYVDPNKPFNLYKKLVNNCQYLNIFLPFCSEEHINFLYSFLENKPNFKLNIIVNPSIIGELESRKYIEKFSSISNHTFVNIYKSDEDFNIFLCTGNNFVGFSLFFNDGFYDDSVFLYDKTSLGCKWGIDLFEYYKSKSKIL